MKNQLVRRSNRMFLCGLGAVLMLFAVSTPTARALDIVWVSQNTDDFSYITALTNADHNVSWQANRFIDLTTDEITELNAADLVIVSRNTNSGAHDDGNEPAIWNGLTTRLMLMSSYLVRKTGKWKWFNNDGLPTVTVNQIVVDADDRAYSGLGVSNGDSTDAYELGAVNSTASTSAGNGTLIARTDDANQYVMAARWSAGTEFYAGSGQTAGWERVYFPGDFDYNNFSAFGKSVFDNLISMDKKWIAKINFQTAGADIPAGYLPDSGEAYGGRGNGLVYGWNENNTGTSRERGVHYDQRFDTLVHMYDTTSFILRSWEIALPNGDYYVDLLCGDPTGNSLTNNFDVEGVVLTDPTPGTTIFDNFPNVAVTVTDGKLTVATSGGFSKQKIMSIKIVSDSNNTVDPDDYARSATIAFDGYTGTTPLTNFPVLVRLNSSTPVSGWYGLADANGYDVQFADADGNLLPHEFELWNPGGESLVWVKVPLVDAADDSIIMYWGRDGQTELDFWPLNVWSAGYAAVWHLDETIGTHYDATGSGHNSSVESEVSQDASGQIDGADSFNGTPNCYVEVPYSATLESAVNGDCTVSIWAHSDVAASSAPDDIAYMCDFGDSHNRGMGLLFNKSHAAFTNGNIAAYYNGQKLGETTGEADTWYHVTLTHEGTNLVLYVNGSVDSTAIASAMNLIDKPFRIGAESKDTTNPDRNWKGLLDEPRISSVPRSSDWIKNEYENQMAASTYCSFDVESMGTLILLQ